MLTNDEVSDLVFNAVALCWQNSDASWDALKWFPDRTNYSVIAFQICMTCNRRTSTVWPEKHLKTACLGGKVSGLSDFGRSCMPNYWH